MEREHAGRVLEGSGPLTEEDYWSFPSDGVRRQLLDGWEVVMASVRRTHQEALMALQGHLWNYLRGSQGLLLSGPYPVRLSAKTVVEPDLFYLAPERRHLAGARACEEAPDLVVEVLSPSNRRVDEVRKLRLYDRHGVREYWIVDPEIQAVKLFQRRGERLDLVVQLQADREDVLESELFPGFALPLTEIFPPNQEDEG